MILLIRIQRAGIPQGLSVAEGDSGTPRKSICQDVACQVLFQSPQEHFLLPPLSLPTLSHSPVY